MNKPTHSLIQEKRRMKRRIKINNIKRRNALMNE